MERTNGRITSAFGGRQCDLGISSLGSVGRHVPWQTQRNAVERVHQPPEAVARHAACYEKIATIYLAGLRIAGIFLWSTRLSSPSLASEP